MLRNTKKAKFQESFSRMNFLYQASVLMAGKNNTLSSYYGELCKNIAKKSVLRIEPNLKRDFCRRCSLAQLPGTTSDLDARFPKKNRKSSPIDDNSELLISCKLCGYSRKLLVNTDYNFWLENKNESVAEEQTI